MLYGTIDLAINCAIDNLIDDVVDNELAETMAREINVPLSDLPTEIKARGIDPFLNALSDETVQKIGAAVFLFSFLFSVLLL